MDGVVKNRTERPASAVASKRAGQLDSASLNQWSESIAMNIGIELSRYVLDADHAHLHESLVLIDSLAAIVEEQIERSLRRY